MSEADVFKMHYEFDETVRYDWIFTVREMYNKKTITHNFARNFNYAQIQLIAEAQCVMLRELLGLGIKVEFTYRTDFTQSLFDELFKYLIEADINPNLYRTLTMHVRESPLIITGHAL